MQNDLYWECVRLAKERREEERREKKRLREEELQKKNKLFDTFEAKYPSLIAESFGSEDRFSCVFPSNEDDKDEIGYYFVEWAKTKGFKVLTDQYSSDCPLTVELLLKNCDLEDLEDDASEDED